ncbi:MoxR family ATPase [Amycolatopsis sp. NPDC058986]|uniref:MoxR family ATPase n=1 Tax=unclassified Amycolatopsis TaxID=2618356 RepID=UPI00366EADE2
MVNAALYLPSPLLATGNPGTGKSSLAYRVSRELGLGQVLCWAITSYTTLGRACTTTTRSAAHKLPQPARCSAAVKPRSRRPAASSGSARWAPRPAGTAVPGVLIGELDKSEADPPNDLLSVFEVGELAIEELPRVRNRRAKVIVHTADPHRAVVVRDGLIACRAFLIVVMTSDSERESSPAFLRRYLLSRIEDPALEQLVAIVASHLIDGQSEHLVRELAERRKTEGGLPTDRLLNAVYLAASGSYRLDHEAWSWRTDALWQRLTAR